MNNNFTVKRETFKSNRFAKNGEIDIILDNVTHRRSAYCYDPRDIENEKISIGPFVTRDIYGIKRFVRVVSTPDGNGGYSNEIVMARWAGKKWNDVNFVFDQKKAILENPFEYGRDDVNLRAVKMEMCDDT